MTREQWRAIRDRDARFDGQFYCGHRAGRIVCRPSCAARAVAPGTVAVFDTLDEALAAGYRPCRRCRPDRDGWEGAKKELSRAAEELMRDNYTRKFSLDEIAGALHVNKCYLLRTFKEVTGETMLACHNRLRCEAARELLERPELSVGYIASAVGYVSASHFAQVFQKYFHCAPSAYRAAYLESLDE